MSEKLKKSEIRKHYFEDRYVIFSPKRAMRPDFIKDINIMAASPISDPFDPEGQKLETPIYELVVGGKWIIRVVANKFAALTPENNKAYGRQEIVIETPIHGKRLNDLPIHHILKIFEIYSQRIRALRLDPKIKYVAIFKNEGGRAAASIPHSHSQIYALPLIPPQIKNEASSVDDYFLVNRSCPYCDIIAKERKEKLRVIYDDGKVIAFCPYAASSPYSAWILPVKHKRNFDEFGRQEKHSFVKGLDSVLDKLDEINMPYNYFLHNSLDIENHHFVFKIEPRPTTWGGLELGSGIIINPIFPEDAAKFFRSKKKSKNLRN